MISRIRLEAFGATADEVERTLYPHAEEIEKLLGRPVSYGQCVIERKLDEPSGSRFAFEGRLILHPDISLGIKKISNLTLTGTGGGTAGITISKCTPSSSR